MSLSIEQEEPDEDAQAALASIDDDIAAIAEPLEEAKKKANKLHSGQSHGRVVLERVSSC